MPTRNEYNLGRPKFVADEGSVMLLGTGAQVNWAAVDPEDDGRRLLHAGTVIWRDPSTGLIEPADTGNGKDANGILVADCHDGRGQNRALHGVYLGGHFYENLMATPPSGADKAALGERFVFIEYEDSRLD